MMTLAHGFTLDGSTSTGRAFPPSRTPATNRGRIILDGMTARSMGRTSGIIRDGLDDALASPLTGLDASTLTHDAFDARSVPSPALAFRAAPVPPKVIDPAMQPGVHVATVAHNRGSLPARRAGLRRTTAKFSLKSLSFSICPKGKYDE